MVSARGGGDTVVGRGGNDDLRGGDGQDDVFGGDGTNELSGGNNSDTINALGSGRDTINCGLGDNDQVIADLTDGVDRTTCEKVTQK